MLARRFGISLAIALGAHNYRSLILVQLCVASLSISWLAQPFLDTKETVMEIVSQTILLIIASITLAHDADFIDKHVTAVVLGWTVVIGSVGLASTIVLQRKVLFGLIVKIQRIRDAVRKCFRQN